MRKIPQTADELPQINPAQANASIALNFRLMFQYIVELLLPPKVRESKEQGDLAETRSTRAL